MVVREHPRVGVLQNFVFDAPDGPLPLSRIGQRLVAAVALHGGAIQRSHLKRALWPSATERRAEANLRSATWRLPVFIRSSMIVTNSTVAFPSSWNVDVDEARRTAQLIRRYGDLVGIETDLLDHDVLPDWDEQWLFVLRESHRQLRLHALEELAERHLAAGRALDAVDAATKALASEPLRESAQQLVLRAHLAAGNRIEVRRLFEQFATLLADELSVRPSDAMYVLLERAAEVVTPS
jgi:DNA-binding SARP family transcriptional activator